MFIESKKVTLHRKTNIMQCTRPEKTISIVWKDKKSTPKPDYISTLSPPKVKWSTAFVKYAKRLTFFLHFKFIPRFYIKMHILIIWWQQSRLNCFCFSLTYTDRMWYSIYPINTGWQIYKRFTSCNRHLRPFKVIISKRQSYLSEFLEGDFISNHGWFHQPTTLKISCLNS